MVSLKVLTRKEALDLDRDIWVDIYFTPQYGAVVEETDGGYWEACLGYDENNKVVAGYVYLKRPIQHSSKLYYDLTSPYGYSGPWANCSSKTFSKFRTLFLSYAISKNYICEFIRFNPYILDCKFLPTFSSNLEKVKTTYGVNLTQDYNTYLKQCKKGHRCALIKAGKDGYTTVIKKLEPSDVEPESVFRKIYSDTMDKNKANNYYYFSNTYYRRLLDLGCTYIVYVKREETVVGVSMFMMYKKRIHYHLSGKVYGYANVSNFTLDSVVRWGKDNGYELLHLGAGLAENDNLARFKKSLSNTSFDYYFTRNIINKGVFDKLCEGVDNTSFFPPYRCPQTQKVS